MEQPVGQPMMQQQPEMGDMKNFPPQPFQQEVQNGMIGMCKKVGVAVVMMYLLIVGGAANQQSNTTDSAPKQQSSFERIVERLSLEYPNYTRLVVSTIMLLAIQLLYLPLIIAYCHNRVVFETLNDYCLV